MQHVDYIPLFYISLAASLVALLISFLLPRGIGFFLLSLLVVLKTTQTGTASKTGQYAHLHTGGEGEEAQVASSARINVKKTKATSRILAWIVSLMTSLDISVSFFSLDRRRPERTLQEHILTGGLSGGRRGGPCAFAGSSLLRGTPAPFGTTLTL